MTGPAISISPSFGGKEFLAIIGTITIIGIVCAVIYNAGREDAIKGAKNDNSDADEKSIDVLQKNNVSAVNAAPMPAIEAQTFKEPPKALPVAAPDRTVSKRKQRVSKSSALLSAKVEKSDPFKHSDDFRTVVCKGISFALTLCQSMAVKEAWEAFKSGFPEVHQEKLLRDVGAANQRRLRDTFKSNPVAFKTLFSRGAGKGTFRLNLA